MIIIKKSGKLHSAIITILCVSSMAISSVASAAWVRSSTVTDAVSNIGNNTWTYKFTVSNTSTGSGAGQPILVDWELPYFNDMDIANIISPAGWAWNIETIGQSNSATGWDGVAAWQNPNDPFYSGANSPYTTGTEVLHWYCNNFSGGGEGGLSCFNPGEPEITPSTFGEPIRVGGKLSGFGFIAGYAPTAAPYQASWDVLPVRTGDPAFPSVGVGSPQALAKIPEPSSLALLGLGLIGLYGSNRKKHNS